MSIFSIKGKSYFNFSLKLWICSFLHQFIHFVNFKIIIGVETSGPGCSVLYLIRITTFLWISASDLGLGYDFDCTYKLPSVDLLDSTVTSPISDIDILKSKKHQYSSYTVPLYSEDLRKGLLDTVYTNLLSSIVILKSKKYKYSSNILPLYNEDLRQGNLKTDETALIFLQNHSKLRNNHVYIFYKRKKLL